MAKKRGSGGAKAETARDKASVETMTGIAEPSSKSAPEQRPLAGVEPSKRDTEVPGIYFIALALVTLIAGSMLFIYLLMAGMGGSPLGKFTEPAQFGDYQRADDDPRYRNLPLQQSRELRAAEASALTTYAWVDRAAGIARIPIDRAIEIVAGRGSLPAAEPTTPTTATTSPREIH